jgi:hypothetical protein
LLFDLTQFADRAFGSGKERQPPSVSLSAATSFEESHAQAPSSPIRAATRAPQVDRFFD